MSSPLPNRCWISIFSKPVFVLVDRIAIGPDLHQRLVDTIEICYREAGEVIFESAAGGDQLRFNEKFQCKTCPPGVRPAGAHPVQLQLARGGVPALPGVRQYHRFRHGPRDSRPVAFARPRRGGAVDQAQGRSWLGNFRKSARGKVRFEVPFADLKDEERESVYSFVRRFFDYLETKKYKLHVRVFLSRYRGYALCPECRGARLRKEALYVRIAGRNLAEVVRMNIAAAQQFFDTLELRPEESAIADKILVEIRQRLKFLNDVGLDYLTLDRLASTLFRRRGAAHPACHLPGVSTGGRVLRARRAFHRPAQPRHGTADPDSGRAARAGQYHCGGGARRRRHAGGGPHCGSGPRRGRARRGNRVRRGPSTSWWPPATDR